MGKTIVFNGQEYTLDESKLALINASIVNYLTTNLAGTGATVKFNGVNYAIDADKLSASKAEIVNFLRTIQGEGEIIYLDGVEYSIDGAALEEANIHSAETLVTLCVSPSEGLAYELNEDGASYSVAGIGACEDTDIIIPAEYDGLPVTSIGSSAFSSCGSLTSVTIPNSVTSIGSSAFSSCYSLTSVTIPNSVTSIGSSAFRGCTSLTSITIPDGVTSIGYWAFRGCTSLTSITIPDGVTSIEAGTFSGCSNLESITLPFVGGWATATSASSSTLFGYIFGTLSYTGGTATKQYYASSSYTTYYIPTSLKSVTITGGKLFYGAFYQCTGLKSVTIPNSVTSIGRDAFDNCTGLTSIEIPDSVTSIDWSAFSGCSGLTSVTIGSSVTSIGGAAFYGCYRLIEVINKSSLTFDLGASSNGYVAYYALEVHDGESKIETQGDYQFYTVDGVNYLFNYIGNDTELTLPEKYNEANYVINDYAFYNNDNITKVTIPDSVTSIGDYAFRNCDSLMSVTIGNSVESIGSYAFQYCSKLVEVINKSAALTITKGSDSNGYVAYYALEVHNGESKIVNQDGYLFYNTVNGVNYLFNYIGNDTEITLPENYNGENYVIKDAFDSNDKIIKVTIPDSVTSIGDSAFESCTGLTSVTIGNSVESIGSYAFCNCESLTSVTIPNSVTSIGEAAFYYCTGLTDIYINKEEGSVSGSPWGADNARVHWNSTGPDAA